MKTNKNFNFSRFLSLHNDSTRNQLQTCCNLLENILDVLPTLSQFDDSAQTSKNHYVVAELRYSALYAKPARLIHSRARISVDNIHNIFFLTVFSDGDSQVINAIEFDCHMRKKILILDVPSPDWAQVNGLCTGFAKINATEGFVPIANTLHKKNACDTAILPQHLIVHTITFNKNIEGMSNQGMSNIFGMATGLIVSAFTNCAWSDTDRSLGKTMALGSIKNYVKLNLDDSELSAEKLLQIFKIPRYTFYRMFEHAGGLSAYIYASRLRAAIDDIAQFPDLTLKDIAYGVGFNSASAFSRAFRRMYGITPQELRFCVKKISTKI